MKNGALGHDTPLPQVSPHWGASLLLGSPKALEGAEKVIALKGRDFRPRRKWSNIKVALATEGIFPR
jgi:hypothetical protein